MKRCFPHFVLLSKLIFTFIIYIYIYVYIYIYINIYVERERQRERDRETDRYFLALACFVSFGWCYRFLNFHSRHFFLELAPIAEETRARRPLYSNRLAHED